MDQARFKECIDRHIKGIETPYHRYASWKICYDEFGKAFKNENRRDIDHLALHLGMYLASFGMMRGSSFLLSCNYKIHYDLVGTLLEKRALWKVRNNVELLSGKTKDIVDLCEKIKEHYKKLGKNATVTLITKILLGTLCCAPAYDRFFVKTFFCKKQVPKKLEKDSLEEICKFYLGKRKIFESIDKNYPPMRLVDMVFFEKGLETSKKEKTTKSK